MIKNNFFKQINDFENIFKNDLTPNNKNSIYKDFVKNSSNFLNKLKELKLEKYKNIDKDKSFIEFWDEWNCRIYFKHKDLDYWIEIVIDNEITIEYWFYAHMHFIIEKDCDQTLESIDFLTYLFETWVSLKQTFIDEKIIKEQLIDNKNEVIDTTWFIGIFSWIKKFFWKKLKVKIIKISWK